MLWGDADSTTHNFYQRVHRYLGPGIEQYGNDYLYIYAYSWTVCYDNHINHYG